MPGKKPDKFLKTTKRKLAERVAYRCSFPNCGKITVGPKKSNDEEPQKVGRACHIEAASKKGPRYNKNMKKEKRRHISNGIWCCNTHADIIDNDYEMFSVSTLEQWKVLAENYAYEAIYSSDFGIEKPHSLVQVGHEIVFQGVVHSIDVEQKKYSFLIIEYVYGNEKHLDEYISKYSELSGQQYFVIDTQGWGRELSSTPSKTLVGDKTIISFEFEPRTQFGNPDNAKDVKLKFEDDGMDLDIRDDDGWAKGKDAIIQEIQVLLGTNQGGWFAYKNLGTFLYKYYQDHHKNHSLLQRLIKLDISRKCSVPEPAGLFFKEPQIPFSEIRWVENLKIIGHSEKYLELELKLYFSDKTYFSGTIRAPVGEIK
ncbi:MAG: hypothetical protein GY847_42035 [Proteobacteria bacterium]|nr:hypothetical protein [Pseudomonadota bacterium]